MRGGDVEGQVVDGRMRTQGHAEGMVRKCGGVRYGGWRGAYKENGG